MADEIRLFNNTELRAAKASMNADVRDMLEEGDRRLMAGMDLRAYERVSGATVENDPPVQLTVEEALSLDTGDSTVLYGQAAPRAPWEVLP